MDDTLKDALRSLLRPGVAGNPALDALLEDYRRYHAVLAVVGGILLLALVVLSVLMWRSLARAPRPEGRRWTFERKVYLAFGVLSGIVALGMALIVAANVSTVLSPRQGFLGSIGMIGPAPAGSAREALYGSVTTWLQSGSPQTPDLLQQAIDERLAWQRPKAIICTVLLVGAVILGVIVWRSLVRRSRATGFRWSAGNVGVLLLGILLVPVALLLMLMVMGNTQGALAPASLTLFLG